MISLVRKALKQGLEVNDLYKARESDKSKELADVLEKNWTEELQRAKLKGKKPALLRALLKSFLVEYMWWGLMFFFQFVVLRSIQPLVLSYLITLFQQARDDDESEEDKTRTMYICSGVLIIVATIIVFFQHHTNKGLTVVGMKVRVAVSSLIYRKITKLNQTSLGETAAGQVVNILSNDVNRFDLVVLSLHSLWALPIQVALLTYFLWRQVQISCLAGILSMIIICVPGQGYLGKLTGVLRFRVAKKTDSRVKLMNEVISGIQVIKMYAWEKSFEKLIKLMRADEIKDLTSASYLRGVFLSCMVFIERLTLFLTVTCYVLLGNVITADKVFSMAQFFNLLQYGIAILYPMAIAYGAETLISVKRLQDFLLLEERKTPTIETTEDNGIQLTNVSASWTSDSSTLKDITLNLPPGTLCAIVGPVGAGKSSLLQLLLGELPSKSGTVNLAGAISYSSQEPWLFQSSVRKNILFGEPYQSGWYKVVVKVCALEKDFDQFPQRDQTIVGERGVSLSGGQRARINLARAIYRKADVYLMDDPLSAVDTHVGRHLFDECIYKHLRGRTRILVTHQLQYLKNADVIVVMNEGRIEAQGSFEELSNSDLDFTKLLVSADETKEESKELVVTEMPKIDYFKRLSIRSIMSTQSEYIEMMEYGDTEEAGVDTNAHPFRDYVKASKNVCLITVVIISLIIAQVVCSGADYWSSFWTSQEEIRHSTRALPVLDSPPSDIRFIALENQTISPDKNLYTNENRDFSFDTFFDKVSLDNREYKLLKTDYSMGVYGILIIAAIVLTVGRSFFFCKMTMLSSTNLHRKMFHTLLEAPMRFFDTNPSGRVLNRFSKDMGSVDEILPRTLLEATQILLVMCGILVNIAIANPYMLVAMVGMGVCFFFLSRWYMTTAINVKHLEGSTKSPVFSHVNSTLNGITTIRAFRSEEILCEEFDDHQDVHTSSWYLTLSCIACFGLWMDIVCIAFLACVTFSFVVLHTSKSATTSFRIIVSNENRFSFNGMLQHGMRQTSEVINQLTSVERIMQYTELETEGPFETPIDSTITVRYIFPDKKPAESWPYQGRVEFRNLVLRYVAEDDPVLKNLTFTVQPGEKVGIVGRTGAGKSSLISALFRLAPTSGSILIDGVDSKVLGLTDLRRKISIIPQEPVLFSATMRYNLDPFDEFDDKNLWEALEQVELKDSVESLDIMVTEGGTNFSLGQRQLICLARAILRDNKILVLDEATANVDQRTDAFIQKTIREKFEDCTVLTIAHRLNTIMDSDKVLVMHFGIMVEYDHPHNLLQLPEGHFHKMVLETGPAVYAQLKDVASHAFEKTGITIVLNLLLNNLKRLETVTLIPSQDFVLPDWLSDYDTIGSLTLKNTQIRGLDSMTLINCIAKEKTPVDASDTSNVMITMLLNLTLDRIELFTGYDIDVGILNMIPLYGIGDLNIWKEAIIVPLPKTNSPEEYKDLRPISISCTLSKAFEKLLSEQMRNHIENYDILPPKNQSGFRPSHSFRSKRTHHSCSPDYSKAFDTIDHELLTAILGYVGFSDDVRKLLKLALSAAKVSVNVDIKIANDFSKISISDLDIQLSFRDSPSYIRGFWKNEDASNIFTGALNILEKFFCMWFDYERTSINSAISNILEFVMNKIILRSIETPDLSKYGCIKKNKYNLLEHLENFALFHENGTTQEYFVSNTTRRDLQKLYSDTIQVIIDILEEGDFSKYML
ncbi:unnamed protein product [Phaedon cochleariae]|uniref:Uncharacterized protein n=1 Tax=Phaedon cochleariae TaxID=80249 RepID=A0A9P0DEQ7_PHACE|nr:unnamed protein product [Phaedon cochleariae]